METFTFHTVDGIKYGSFPALEQLGFINAFTCRQGGESLLVPGSLNLALHVGDAAGMVLRNRQKAARAIGFDLKRTVTCAQVHGHHVVTVGKADGGKGVFDLASTIPDTDGLVTGEAGVPLMLFYADCTPVLLVDPVKGVLALVHAGWRGSVACIGTEALELMERQFGTQASDVIAAIGPSIGPCCYEVDERVHKEAPGFEDCFVPTRPGHYQMDLWKLNREALCRAGVKADRILTAQVCTAESQDYFSYRAEKGRTGRFAAILYRK
jgi:YfiH family protein